jgi:hypothetical protein
MLALLATAALAAQTGGPARGHRVSGSVFDSLSRRPFAAAEVHLLRETVGERPVLHTTRTDSRGRFAIDGVEPGRYAASFYHPLLDSLGLDAPVYHLDIPDGDAAGVVLAIPTRASILAAFCPAELVVPWATLLSGTVRDARSGAPRPGAILRMRWTTGAVRAGEIVTADVGGRVRAGADGRFVVCDGPAGVDLLVDAAEGADSSGQLLLRYPEQRVMSHDLYIGRSEADAPGAPRRGTARLRGRVRAESGEPVPGARVTLLGAAGEATGANDGTFALESLPAGSYTLSIRALGYVPAHRPIDLLIGGGAQNVVEVVLTHRTSVLDTVRVSAEAERNQARDGLEQRRRGGRGTFIIGDSLAHVPAMMSEALAPLAGILVRQGAWGRGVFMRDGTGQPCVPALYIDGLHYDLPHGVVDDLVDPAQVHAVEIYPRPADVPPIFRQITRSGCGAIVVWTRASASLRGAR